ncbi:replication protein, partial [Escherichia coli]
KRGIKHPSNWGIAIPQNRGTQKTLLQKKKEKIIRQRILANPLTSQKTTFLW